MFSTPCLRRKAWLLSLQFESAAFRTAAAGSLDRRRPRRDGYQLSGLLVKTMTGDIQSTKRLTWNGPNRDQWCSWNETHGAMIRTACAIMRTPNEKITELMAACAADGATDQMLSMFDDSAKFFGAMHDLLATASARLRYQSPF
jgi:hypothetical protein